jgi:predicted TIM-barrel fold metal-dependent hydrolase
MPIFDSHVLIEGNPIPGINQNAGQIAQILRPRGIESALVFSTRAAQADPLSGNRILKAMIEQEAGLYAGVTAHLNRVDASLQAIRELMGGKRFLAVLLTSTHPNEPLHPIVADEVLNACRRFQKPIMIKTPNAACVEAALHLAGTYNMHKFVLIGMGGTDWRTGIAAAHQAPNILLETSGVLDRAKVPAAIEVLGTHRVLFGSGMPHLDPAAALGLLEDSDIPAGDRRRILYDNAARLFNLAEIET